MEVEFHHVCLNILSLVLSTPSGLHVRQITAKRLINEVFYTYWNHPLEIRD